MHRHCSLSWCAGFDGSLRDSFQRADFEIVGVAGEPRGGAEASGPYERFIERERVRFIARYLARVAKKTAKSEADLFVVFVQSVRLPQETFGALGRVDTYPAFNGDSKEVGSTVPGRAPRRGQA